MLHIATATGGKVFGRNTNLSSCHEAKAKLFFKRIAGWRGGASLAHRSERNTPFGVFLFVAFLLRLVPTKEKRQTG